MPDYPAIRGSAYEEVLGRLRTLAPGKVVVTGPQRSGTRIASRILAADLDYRFVDEKEFAIQDWRIFEALLGDRDRCVYHAPALSYLAHVYGRRPGVAVVFLCRSCRDMIASEDRIGWRTAFDGLNPRVEEEKYRPFAALFDADDPISVKKYKVLMGGQGAGIVNLLLLDYESLSAHPLWKNKPDRAGHSWDETWGSAQVVRRSLTRDNGDRPGMPAVAGAAAGRRRIGCCV